MKEETGPRLRGKAWIPAVVGAVAVGAGAYLMVETSSFAGQVERGEGVEPAELDQSIASARTRQTLGVALLGVGTAALATAVVFFVTGSEPSAQPSIVVTPGSVHAALTWRFR